MRGSSNLSEERNHQGIQQVTSKSKISLTEIN